MSPEIHSCIFGCTPDENAIPFQLRTHYFLRLKMRELMQVVEGKPNEHMEREINNLFMASNSLLIL